MKALKIRLLRLRAGLGLAGLGGLGLLAATALFFSLVLKPLQEKNRALESSLARHASQSAGAASGKLERFYDQLGKAEAPTDWLAKLYGISKATGVELQSGSYRTGTGEKAPADKAAGGRIERYEIVLPVSGSYRQLREFLKRALVEIPVLSLDQLTLKRESRNEGAVNAELKMTLHLVKP